MESDGSYGKCPVEAYDAEVATVVLRSIYSSRDECGHAHGCVRKACALEPHWPRPGRAAETWTNLSFGGFIAVAHNGPTRPDAKGLEGSHSVGENPRTDDENPRANLWRDPRASD